MKQTWLSRTLGTAPVQESRPAPRRTLLQRALGEDDAARADQKPPEPARTEPPAPDRPDDSNVHSMADLDQQQASEETHQQGGNSALEQAYSMWQSGSKYDACNFMLRSDFRYADLIQLVQMLDPEDGVELGTIMDEIAPPNAESGDAPQDTVSAVTGQEPESAPAQPETNDEPTPEPSPR